MKPKWLREAEEQIENMSPQAKEVKKAAENDLFFFAKLVNPSYVYGHIHAEIFRWMQEYNLYTDGDELSNNKLIMLPRAHLKSHMVATWVAWMIVRHPEITILYVSATAELAISQLYDIKGILDSKIFKKYWPNYIHPDVGKREKWSETTIMVDHPVRKEEGVRDATVKTAGLTTNTTGWHADVICADDLVVPENAYTEEGRSSVSRKSSQFTSIRNPGGFTMACGTRYHPADIYDVWMNAVYEDYDTQGNSLGYKPIWEVKEYVVEEEGVFLWPRTMRTDGKAFGFDPRTLSRIKAEYTDKEQFFAQYYNNPNSPESDRLSRDKFQYYNPRYLVRQGNVWMYKGDRLNVYAAVDFAYSMNKQADYTAIVVIGIDYQGHIYVLDIDRFKTFKTIDYFKHIKELHSKWNFKKLRTEINVAQKTISESIKDYIKKEGLRLSIEEFRPSRADGSKEERIAAVLEHRYDDMTVWHFEGGWTQVLEDELIAARPKHDDVKDALAAAVSIAVKPSNRGFDKMKDFITNHTMPASRFGGFN